MLYYSCSLVTDSDKLPVGFSPPVFDGAMPANPNAAKPANGFLVKLICCY